MTTPRALALALSLASASLEATAAPSCAARVTTSDVALEGVAARLRAVLASLDGQQVECGVVALRREGARVMVEATLPDGRVARRALRAVDDCVPTALALLATSRDAHDAPQPAPTPAAPVAPVAAAPVAQESPAQPPPAQEPPVTPAAPPPAGSAWTLRAGAGLGAGWGGGRWLFTQRAEVDVVWRRVSLGVRGQWASNEADEDEGAPEVHEQSYGLAARWIAPAGRWRFELGGVVAAASVRASTRETDGQRRRAQWSLRGGAELGASVQLTRALSAFARAECLATVARFTAESAAVEDGPVSASLALGLRLEVSP